jgi:hypothetical protein
VRQERIRCGLAGLILAVLVTATACSLRTPVVTHPVLPMRTEPIPVARGPLPSDRFAALFCGVLELHQPDPGQWGFCRRYFSPSATPEPIPAAIPANAHLLVIPGIFGQCVEDYARPWEDALEHLRKVHGLPVEYVSVSAMGSTNFNARQIHDYLAAQPDDGRPYIVFGYSKGASDVLEALQTSDVARRRIAAVVTIAGSVLGSRLAEGVPADFLRGLRDVRLGPCEVGDGGGVASLQRHERVKAVAALQFPATVKTYSIAAVSSRNTTRPALRNGWDSLSVFSLEQDSQVIHEDAIVPGAEYLGMALGDHWSVALPFERIPSTIEQPPALKALRAGADYPRVALFEAAIRYAMRNIPAKPH